MTRYLLRDRVANEYFYYHKSPSDRLRWTNDIRNAKQFKLHYDAEIALDLSLYAQQAEIITLDIT